MTEYNGDKLAYPPGKYFGELDEGCSSNEKLVVLSVVTIAVLGIVSKCHIIIGVGGCG